MGDRPEPHLVGQVFNGEDGRGIRCNPTPELDGPLIVFADGSGEHTVRSYADAVAECGEDKTRQMVEAWTLTLS